MTLGTREFSKEAKSAIAVMRSLIISEKGTSSLFRILGDFRKEEGHPLMYKDFGYRSAAEFLEATGEFILREQNGEVVIFVKPSEESSHIQKMIAAQKSTKPRAAAKKPAYATTWNKTPYQMNRFPGGQNKFQGYQQQQQKQQYSSYQQQPKTYYSSYQQQQQQPAKSFGSYQGSYQQQVKQATNFYQPQQQQQSKPVSSYQQQQRYNSPNNPLSSYFGGGMKPAIGTQSQPKPASMPKEEPPVATPARPSNSTNPFLQSLTNPFMKPEQPVEKPPNPAAAAPTKMDNVPPTDFKPAPQVASSPTPSQLGEDQKMDTSENYAMPAARTIRQSFKAPINESVFTPESITKVVQAQQQSLMEKKEVHNKTREEILPSSSQSPPKKPSSKPFKWDQPGTKPEELLFQYGQLYDSLPVYKFFQVNKRFHCKVTINGTVYRTYPNDYATELEGKSAVARIAIDAIRRNETRQYRVCDGTDEEIASKIYDLLLPCQYGMQLDNIPKAFRDSHGSLLPGHWKLIVQANLTRLFKSEEIPNHSVVVFAVLSEEDNPSEQAQRMSTNLIELPWGEQYWDLYVTHPVSPDEIWARLVGVEYSDRMTDLMTSIEQSMTRGEKRKPKKVIAGEFYLVQLNDLWHRVRVERLERAANACQCFFIDLGGTDSVPLNLIYECESRFLELPGQTVCFALEGLQGMGDDANVTSYLQDLVSGKVLIGEVHTTKETYEAKGVTISITLFDTSFEEDVNINDVMKSLRNETPER